MAELNMKCHSDIEEKFTCIKAPSHLDAPNGSGSVPKAKTSAEDLNGPIDAARPQLQHTRSPRYEAFLMTGDKILRLNPKISPNYARLKQSQLPRHTEILETSVSSCLANNRSMEGPFSDLETLSMQQRNCNLPSKVNGNKVKYKYLQEHAAIFKPLSDCNGQMPVSHSENLLTNEENEACKSDNNFSAADNQKSTEKANQQNFCAAPSNGKSSGGASIVTVNADADDRPLKKSTGVGGCATPPSSPSGFMSEPTSPARHAFGTHSVRRDDVRSATEGRSRNGANGGKKEVANFNNADFQTRDYELNHKSAQGLAVAPQVGQGDFGDKLEAAKRLARRLFELDGFSREDAGAQLSKKNDFGAAIATEYMKLLNFAGLKIDAALRMLLQKICLTGETADRERLLSFFSRRYYENNPSLFNSENEVHTLACALLLLNSDLHNKGLSKHMNSREFIDNILQAGHNYSMDLLKSLFQSVKSSPIECSNDFSAQSSNSRTSNRTQLVDARFLDIPDPDSQVEYKKGWVVRKCLVDSEGRKMPFGRRSWRMFYATLKGMIFYLHKDEFGFKKSFYNSAHNAIRIHHALAVKATDYCKKQNVFKLQTATLAEFYFQTSDPRELQDWINAVNFVAACFSSPSLPGAVSWCQASFHRPLLASAPSRLCLREQLEMHEERVSDTRRQLTQHRKDLPQRSAKARVLQAYAEKEIFLIYELERYSTYAKMLRPKVEEFSQEFTTRLSSQEYSRGNGSSGDSEETATVKLPPGNAALPGAGQSTDSDPDRVLNDCKTVHVKGWGYETTF